MYACNLNNYVIVLKKKIKPQEMMFKCKHLSLALGVNCHVSLPVKVSKHPYYKTEGQSNLPMAKWPEISEVRNNKFWLFSFY